MNEIFNADKPLRTSWNGTFYVRNEGYSIDLTIGNRRALYPVNGIERLIFKARARNQETSTLEKLHQYVVYLNQGRPSLEITHLSDQKRMQS